MRQKYLPVSTDEFGQHVNHLHTNKNHLFDKQFEVCMLSSIGPHVMYEFCISRCTTGKTCLRSLDQSPLTNAKTDF